MTALLWFWVHVMLRGGFFLVIKKKNLHYKQPSLSIKNTVETLTAGNAKINELKLVTNL